MRFFDVPPGVGVTNTPTPLARVVVELSVQEVPSPVAALVQLDPLKRVLLLVSVMAIVDESAELE